MKGFPLMLAALLLAACGGRQDADTADSTRAGVERANADIRAAEAAARAPVSLNRSIGELTGRPVQDARDAPPPKDTRDSPPRLAARESDAQMAEAGSLPPAAPAPQPLEAR